MNNEHVKGKWNEVKGTVKENIGHVTGDNKAEASGIGDQVKGKIQKGFGDVKDTVKAGVDKLLNKDNNADQPTERDRDTRRAS